MEKYNNLDHFKIRFRSSADQPITKEFLATQLEELARKLRQTDNISTLPDDGDKQHGWGNRFSIISNCGTEGLGECATINILFKPTKLL